MKRSNAAFLLILWLFSQQVFAVLPHHHAIMDHNASVSMEPGNRHGSSQHGSTHHWDGHEGHAMNHNDHNMDKQSCCDTTCSCLMSHCATAAITTHLNPYLFAPVITGDNYTFSVIPTPPDPYLRPPISL